MMRCGNGELPIRRWGLRLVVALVLWFGVFGTAAAQTSDTAAPKPLTAAVLDFQGRGVGADEPKVLADRFRVELFRRHVYRLLERSEVDKILKEQGFQKSGACDQSECAVDVGKLLGVRRMIIGVVSRIGATWTVTVRVVDVETGEIVQSAVLDRHGNIDGLLQPGMADLARKLQGGMDSLQDTASESATKSSSLFPKTDFARPFRNIGVGSSAAFQVGLLPSAQLVPESRIIHGLALSLPWTRNAYVSGVQLGVINQVRIRMDGVQLGVANLGGDAGFLQAGLVNKAQGLSGFQIGLVNVSDHAQGLQVGLFNYARRLHGVQVGFINVAPQGAMFPVFPLVNGSF